MGWMGELRAAFSQLLAGTCPQVSFSERGDTVGEVGREFNALAALVDRIGTGEASREVVHGARNHLAGILAAVHVFGETNELSGEDKSALTELLQEARELDARLRRQ
jgi:hypothetical protein